MHLQQLSRFPIPFYVIMAPWPGKNAHINRAPLLSYKFCTTKFTSLSILISSRRSASVFSVSLPCCFVLSLSLWYFILFVSVFPPYTGISDYYWATQLSPMPIQLLSSLFNVENIAVEFYSRLDYIMGKKKLPE